MIEYRDENRELEEWREEWRSVGAPSPDFELKLKEKIKRQDRRFVLGNVLTAVAFLGMLIFAATLPFQASQLGTGWAAGVCVLVVVSVTYRLWIMRGAWRAQTRSTRAFMELWRRRVQSRIRGLQIGIYVSFGWIIFCAVLTAINWTTIGAEVKAHPNDWIGLLVVSLLMQPVLWFGAAYFRRRYLAELSQVEQILNEMNEGEHEGTGVPPGQARMF